MTLLAAAFAFAISNMNLPVSCGHIPLPYVKYSDLSRHNRMRRGEAYRGTPWIVIDKSVQGLPAEGAYLAHEIVHYALSVCGLPDDERLAVEIQYAWSDQ